MSDRILTALMSEGLEAWPAHDRARLVALVSAAMEECITVARLKWRYSKHGYVGPKEAGKNAAALEASAEATRELIRDLRLAGFLRDCE